MYVILRTSFKLLLQCLRFYIIADKHNLIHIVLADYLDDMDLGSFHVQLLVDEHIFKKKKID